MSWHDQPVYEYDDDDFAIVNTIRTGAQKLWNGKSVFPNGPAEVHEMLDEIERADADTIVHIFHGSENKGAQLVLSASFAHASATADDGSVKPGMAAIAERRKRNVHELLRRYERGLLDPPITVDIDAPLE